MYRPFSTIGLETIVGGARLMATVEGYDPATLESIIRKSVRVAREATMQDTRRATANDDAFGVVR